MKTRLVLSSLIIAAMPAIAVDFTENFDSGLGSFDVLDGNTTLGNNFDFSNTNNSGGVSLAGEISGTFARTSSLDYVYIGTNDILPGATGSSTLTIAGEGYVSNDSFDGGIFIGYVGTGTANPGYIALEIAEPSGLASDPFRGRIFLRDSNGGNITGANISIAQNTPFTFSLTYDGATGTLSGDIAGTFQSVTAQNVADLQATSFDIFGVGSGVGVGSSNSALTTASTTSFDALTYTVPEPGAASLLLLGLGAFAARRRRG